MSPRTRKPRRAQPPQAAAAPSYVAGEPDRPLASADDSAWNHSYYQLHQFHRQHGHCDLPTHDKAYRKLVAWVAQQRALHQRGKLPVDRQAALDALGLTWLVREEEEEDESICRPAHEATWQQRYAELVAFQEAHGHTRVSRAIGGSDTLCNWRHIQRLWRRKGILRPERIALLDAIGFEWVEPESFGRTRGEMNEHHWEQMFQELVQFKARFGHCRVASTWKENPDLAKWVTRHRTAYARQELRPDRQARLDALGFTWHIGPSAHGDAMWERQFADLLAFQAITGHTRVTKAAPGNVKLRNWRHIQREWRRRGDLKPERIARLDAIGFEWDEPEDSGRTPEQLEQRWAQMYGHLVQFKKRFGHCRVSPQWKEPPGLGKWVLHQRSARTRAELRPDRIARLDALGFPWRIGAAATYHELWEQRFGELLAFKALTGHTCVPKTAPGNPVLWNWRMIQRQFRRQGKLSPERFARLDAIGFAWDEPTHSPNPVRHNQWERRFQELANFRRRFGHCRVGPRYRGSRGLPAWITVQRAAYRKDALAAQRQARLEALGFQWSLKGAGPLPAVWEQRFAELQAFFQLHGHTRVPTRPSRYHALWRWRRTQRELRRQGLLDADRIARMDALGFDWGPRADSLEARWSANLERLRAFQQRFGHGRVPRDSEEYPHLAEWLREQRRAGQQGRLRPERRDQLEALGFSWEPAPADGRSDFRGDRRLNELAAFRERFGHTRVPIRWQENPGLGSWVSSQRHAGCRDLLPPERRARLESLGFDWGPAVRPGTGEPHPPERDDRMRQLAAYRERFGDTRVPKKWRENPGLGAWVSIQRYLRRKGRLSARRIADLDALGFDWQPPHGPRGFVSSPHQEGRLQQLAAFRERFGHTRVPRKWPEAPGLGGWVASQRHRLRLGQLSPHRIAQLEALGF